MKDQYKHIKGVLMDHTKSPVVLDEIMEPEPSISEIRRSLHIRANANARRQEHANEVALKGLYVNWLFNKLNLTQYR